MFQVPWTGEKRGNYKKFATTRYEWCSEKKKKECRSQLLHLGSTLLKLDELPNPSMSLILTWPPLSSLVGCMSNQSGDKFGSGICCRQTQNRGSSCLSRLSVAAAETDLEVCRVWAPLETPEFPAIVQESLLGKLAGIIAEPFWPFSWKGETNACSFVS